MTNLFVCLFVFMELKLLGAICCELLFFLEKIFLPRASVKKGKRGVNIYIFNNMNMRIQEEERSEILRNKENQFDWDSDSGNLFCCFCCYYYHYYC